MRIIENTEDLKKLCHELKKQKFITVDSEFVREKSYYPVLCLLQVGWLDDAAIIDPLAPEMDLSAFLEIMQNKKILKVFHSGRQDIEIFYNISGKIPTPVFDTQIAAMVAGFGASVSYDGLVRAITKTELDKSSRLTDWSIRPLDRKQLAYALRDVTFLIPCYQYLAAYLKTNKRQAWIEEEMAALVDENLYKPDPENAWQKIHHSAHSPRFLAVLKALASWRELRAIKFNIPRKLLLKDEILLNITAAMPQTLDDLMKVRNIRTELAKGKLGLEIVEVIQTALREPVNRQLRKIEREKQISLPSSAAALMELLRLVLKIRSEQEGVVARLVASEQDLRQIATGHHDTENKALSGWRYELFGKYALAFRKGKAVLNYDTKKKDIVIELKS